MNQFPGEGEERRKGRGREERRRTMNMERYGIIGRHALPGTNGK